MSDLKEKKNKLLKLLLDKNIKIDSFALEYLENANSSSVELVFNYIKSGDYASSCCAEGDVKDILVGNYIDCANNNKTIDMMPSQTEELRLKAIIYVARQYKEWPESNCSSVQSVSHCGYSWKLDGDSFVLLRVEGGITDTITEDDIKNYIERYKTLVLHETYNSEIIYDFAKENQLSWDRIGFRKAGKSIVVFTDLNGKLHSTYLLLTDNFEYKRVL